MLVTTGMREVAAMFANPFGKDSLDFPVNEWLSEMRFLFPEDIHIVLVGTPESSDWAVKMSSK